MKRNLGILLIAMVLILPLKAKALTFANPKTMCEKSCLAADGRCEQKCTITITDNRTTIQDITIGLNYSTGVSIKSITEETGWVKNGLTSPIKFTNLDGVSDNTFKLATIVFDVQDAQTDCSITFKVDDVEVTYKEEKQEEQQQPTNPSTGVSLPVVVLLSGLGISVIAYIISKRNTKMYKI